MGRVLKNALCNEQKGQRKLRFEGIGQQGPEKPHNQPNPHHANGVEGIPSKAAANPTGVDNLYTHGGISPKNDLRVILHFMLQAPWKGVRVWFTYLPTYVVQAQERRMAVA